MPIAASTAAVSPRNAFTVSPWVFRWSAGRQTLRLDGPRGCAVSDAGPVMKQATLCRGPALRERVPRQGATGRGTWEHTR